MNIKKCLTRVIIILFIIQVVFITSGCNKKPDSVIHDLEFGDYMLSYITTDEVYEYPQKAAQCNGYVITKYLGNEENVILPTAADNGIPIIMLGKYSFLNNSSIKSIIIPDGYEAILGNSFSNCSALESVYIGSTIKYISSYCIFSSCPNLKEIAINSNNPVYYCTNNCIIETQNKKLITGCNITSIPDDIKIIGNWAFSEQSSMQKILELPQSINSIEMCAFELVSNIEYIYIGKNVEYIGDNAFLGISTARIYCEAIEKPTGWSEYWCGEQNEKYNPPTILWGASKELFYCNIQLNE